MGQAFQRFMAQQQPLISKGGYESQSKYTDNHNVEFETISSHSNTNTAKMLSKNRHQLMMQSRGENNDGSMSAPPSYPAAKSYHQNSNMNSSMHEASRLSNNQSMRMRGSLANNQTAPQKQSARGNPYGGGGQHQELSGYEQQHERKNDDNFFGRREGQPSLHEDSMPRENQQSLGEQPYKRARKGQKFADPELDVQDLDQIMKEQNHR